MKRLAVFLLAFLIALPAWAQVKRARHDGMHASLSSSTAGVGNMHLSLFGRTFLWDNDAAQKIPPAMPHVELNYGATDYLDVAIGVNALSYVLQPGFGYLRVKASPHSNKALRLFGVAGMVEARHQLLDHFPSNGYRLKSEGFSPEGFVYGNDDLITSLRAVMAVDFECIRLSSYLPFKFYLNLGWEFAFSSFIEEDNAALARAAGRPAPDQSFAKIPLSAGLELKTFNTDFFVEVEADPFLANLVALGRNRQGWTRYRMIDKAFDLSLWESPIYANIGGRMKYSNGLQLQGGMAWLLSGDLGAALGPCHPAFNACKVGATDGFSPFYPQWKVFGLIRYPLRFTQPSSEMYRSLLLRRYENRDHRVDVEKTLGRGGSAEDAEEKERRLRLEERRREADAKAVDLN